MLAARPWTGMPAFVRIGHFRGGARSLASARDVIEHSCSLVSTRTRRPCQQRFCMTQIRRIDAGVRMSQAVVYNGMAYLAGSVAVSMEAGIKQQTEEVLQGIQATLESLGTGKDRLLSAQIWLKDIGRDFATMNSVWEGWLPPGAAPTRATCQALLADPRLLVEIIVTAAVD